MVALTSRGFCESLGTLTTGTAFFSFAGVFWPITPHGRLIGVEPAIRSEEAWEQLDEAALNYAGGVVAEIRSELAH